MSVYIRRSRLEQNLIVGGACRISTTVARKDGHWVARIDGQLRLRTRSNQLESSGLGIACVVYGGNKPLLKRIGHYICDNSWAPAPTGVPEYSKIFKSGPDDSRMDPRSTRKCWNNIQRITRNPLKKNLCLPSGLSHVTLQTLNDHQQMSESYQQIHRMSKTC